MVNEETQNPFFVTSERKKIKLRYVFPADILESERDTEREKQHLGQCWQKKS